MAVQPHSVRRYLFSFRRMTGAARRFCFAPVSALVNRAGRRSRGQGILNSFDSRARARPELVENFSLGARGTFGENEF
jgi:hypothetical protein